MTRHLRTLRLASFVRYSWWRIRGNRRDIAVSLRDGTRLLIREGVEDYWIASEIFFDRQYDPPVPIPFDRFETIVDVGANVGFLCLWFLRASPATRIVAYEPLPEHVEQIRRNLARNGWQDRVDLVPAAASTAPGAFALEPAGARTAIVSRSSPSTVTVPAVDWFSQLPPHPIDLVKIDIEGGERALLADPRFASAAERIRHIVVEWHDPDGGRDERRWCERKLAEAGFTVAEGADYRIAGLLWGVREQPGVGGEHEDRVPHP